MRRNSKGQVSLEYLIVTSLVLLFLVAMGIILYQKYTEWADLRTYLAERTVVNTVADSINQVVIAGDGYWQTFTISSGYPGVVFNVTFKPNEPTVFISMQGMTMHAPLLTSNISCGTNYSSCITTADGTVIIQLNNTLYMQASNYHNQIAISAGPTSSVPTTTTITTTTTPTTTTTLVGFLCQITSGNCSAFAGQVCAFALSDTSNAQAGTCSNSSYAYQLCCNESAGSLSVVVRDGGCQQAGILSISAVDNAHAEEYPSANYANDVCMASTAGTLSCQYSSSACAYPYSCVVTLSDITNAHIGDCTVYPANVNICCEIT